MAGVARDGFAGELRGMSGEPRRFREARPAMVTGKSAARSPDRGSRIPRGEPPALRPWDIVLCRLAAVVRVASRLVRDRVSRGTLGHRFKQSWTALELYDASAHPFRGDDESV